MDKQARIEEALHGMSEGISTWEAARKFKLSQSTLSRRARGANYRVLGRPNKYSDLEETMFADLLLYCDELEVPLSKPSLEKIVWEDGVTMGCVSSALIV